MRSNAHLCLALFALAGEVHCEVRFVDAAAAAGLDFVHQSGRHGELWTVEITGAGVAVLDFDGDGWLDVWLVQGGPLLARAEAQRKGALPNDRLFRNVGRGELRFEDITEQAGVAATGYGMGIATGDIDNDGDLDVFLTNFGANQLFENLGDGRFEDITDAAGIGGEAWSIAASFADIDGDGWLDLYVGNYLDFPLRDYRPCRRWSSRPTYCAPSNFDPVSDRLYRNLGNGRFADISVAAGIAGPYGGAMSVVAEDFNGDGATDFYVANDGVDNLLWLNRGDGRFEEGALLAGVAVNADGKAEASMGIAAADFDHDDDADLFVTHDIKESNTLYVNDGAGWFEDRSVASGVAAPSLPHTAFGTGWVDVDNDGDLDIINVNGAVAIIERQLAAGIEPPLRQADQLLLNEGGTYVAANGGPAFAHDDIGRGAAFGDLDNDGDIDVLVANNDGPARVYRNDTAGGNYLGVTLLGGDDTPSGLGALVWLDGERGQRRRVRTDGSYASANDPRLLFGLGGEAVPQFVRVRWPDASEERFGPLAVNRYHVLRRGRGDASEGRGKNPTPAVRFTEVAASAGVDFVHDNGGAGERWLAEIMGAGAAVFDFDGDARLDIWLVQGGPLAGRDQGGEQRLPSDRLYRNVSEANLRFQDVTENAGVLATGYGMGIATGDIDNDGDLDVFLANFGANQLYENLGSRFRDITEQAGVAGDEWSVSASFADIDGDGLLDLYVANYVDFSLSKHKVCRDFASRPTFCTPESYPPLSDRLYRNLGDGHFADISAAAGVDAASAGGLGVVADDFDGNGKTDFYVANDPVDNLLWLNQGDGRFVDHALPAGAAVNGDGDAEASMGVDAEDHDQDCDVDLFLTHLVAETNTLYSGDGAGGFADVTNASGLAASSGPFTGFGTGWFDADNDGDLDLFSANGAVTEIEAQLAAGLPHPFRQRNQVWLNDGQGHYREARGGALDLQEASRGAAFGDLDNDGDIDIVVTNNRGPARIYRNDTTRGRWIGIQLNAGPEHNAYGATVQLESSRCSRRRIATDGSYASASDPRLVFGSGRDGVPKFVRVRWPDGAQERFGPLATDRYHRLTRAVGAPPP